MSKWIFEPGHTEAQFKARHLMVTWVRGFFKDVHGSMEFDWDNCLETTFEGTMDASKIWTGEADRDAHLRSADFFDVEVHPSIDFTGRFTERTGDIDFRAEAELTIRGVAKNVPLDVTYEGQWDTPFWEGEENRARCAGPASRRGPGSTATTSAFPGRTRFPGVASSSPTESRS